MDPGVTETMGDSTISEVHECVSEREATTALSLGTFEAEACCWVCCRETRLFVELRLELALAVWLPCCSCCFCATCPPPLPEPVLPRAESGGNAGSSDGRGDCDGRDGGRPEPCDPCASYCTGMRPAHVNFACWGFAIASMLWRREVEADSTCGVAGCGTPLRPRTAARSRSVEGRSADKL